MGERHAIKRGAACVPSSPTGRACRRRIPRYQPETGPSRALDASAAMSHSVRIALVTDTYVPQINGVSTVVHRIVQALGDRGVAVTVVAPRYPNAPADPPGEPRVRSAPFPPYPAVRLSLPPRAARSRGPALRGPATGPPRHVLPHRLSGLLPALRGATAGADRLAVAPLVPRRVGLWSTDAVVTQR
jgi:hypothetical protein